MRITFDQGKNDRNLQERGLAFALAEDFEWLTALIVEDLRKDHGEARYQALGLIGDRLHMLVFTPRGDAIHVISLRKANPREVRRYEAQRTR